MAGHCRAILLASVAIALPPASAFDLQTVLERQERAMGDLSALRTMSLSMRMEEPEERFELAIRFARHGAMRVDLRKLGVGVYSEGYGTRGPWQQHILQWSPRPTSAAGAEAIRNGVEGFAWSRSLRELRDRGHAVSLLEPASADELGVLVRFLTGTERRYFLDPQRFRIVRTEQTYALHPDRGGAGAVVRQVSSAWLDYRTVGGITVPMRIVSRDLATNEIVQTITIGDLVINPRLDPAIFEGR